MDIPGVITDIAQFERRRRKKMTNDFVMIAFVAGVGLGAYGIKSLIS